MEEFSRKDAITRMTNNLKVLRNKLNLTQNELAGKIGVSRQTIVNIENKKRVMSWNTFVALIAIFRAKSDTSDLLCHFSIYTAALNNYLTSSENVNLD